MNHKYVGILICFKFNDFGTSPRPGKNYALIMKDTGLTYKFVWNDSLTWRGYRENELEKYFIDWNKSKNCFFISPDSQTDNALNRLFAS